MPMYVKPKKYLGQHFLTDDNIAKSICDAIKPDCPNVLEIGPGKGVLSQFMLPQQDINFKAVELDMESVMYLQDTYPDAKDKFIFGDFLKENLDKFFDTNCQILGNFPYNISSQILFKVLENRNKVDCVVGMFQKEVARRIISPPGNKEYGILSVLMQTWYDGEYLFTVNEGSFFPPPKVKSGVVKFLRNNVTDIGVPENLFVRVVKTAFNQRRKTLRNSLKTFDLQNINAAILQKRPEQLSWQDFVSITKDIMPLIEISK